MSDPAPKRRATYQDVLDAPERMVAEIVAGELHTSPRPSGPASVARSTLTALLLPPFMLGGGGEPGGWILIAEPEIHIGESIVVPDLAGWRLETLPVVPDAAFIAVAPDWVCEVLSPSTERFDRAEKMPLYASIGVSHGWLVHPRRRTLEAFRLHDGMWLATGVYKDLDRARIEPFGALELDLSKLWEHVALPTRASEEAAEYERSF
ncbi:MAG: Uma2 family endonuclease [Kofleriaceae bacterium]